LEIEIVESESDLNSFSFLTADVFALNSKSTGQWLQLNFSITAQNQQVNFLAFLDGKPVRAVTLSTGKSSAGLRGLATLSEYRNCGIGAALINVAILKAKDLQYTQVVAILLFKGMAWNIFTKLGFQSVYEFPFYIHGSSSKVLEK
jgi:GNAT superfamily N-acetyltransferase